MRRLWAWLLLPPRLLVTALDKALDRWVERAMRKERHGPTRGLMFLTLGLLVLVVTSQLWMPEGIRDFLVTAMAGGFIATPLGHRLAYQRGYRQARMAFWLSMNEAQARNLPPHAWLRLEAERDGLQVDED